MATVLVVDDSAIDRTAAAGLLRHRASLNVVFADSGRAALEAVHAHRPDLVITDMQMPDLDGLELVDALRQSHPSLPVILMTAHGSEELAALALLKGAASYVPKRFMARDLAPTVERLLDLIAQQQREPLIVPALGCGEFAFWLDNESRRVGPLVRYLLRELAMFGACDENDQMRVGVALDEALSNAIHHGNLEVSSQLREVDMAAYFSLINERIAASPYRDRRVFVRAAISRDEATFVIRDDGKGFDPSALPDPTDPANLQKTSGRGLLLIRTFMDEVRHNAAGNEITMVKHRGPGTD